MYGLTWLTACLLVIGALNHSSGIAGNVSSQWNVTCPSGCHCSEQHVTVMPRETFIRTVDCSHRKLRHLPANIPTDTEALLLKNNIINVLVPSHFSDLTSLQYLDLSYNDLEQLGPLPVFGNLSSMRILNLEGNHLSTLVQNTFLGLPELDELDVSANRLTSIDRHAFSGLHGLRLLFLSRNHLPVVRQQWFADLPNLRQLWLDHNQLNGIDGGSLLGLTSLTSLQLAYNNLSTLGADSFMGLSELGRLDLSHNRLDAVPGQALAGFRRLKVLSLDANPIRILTPGSLQALTVDELNLCNMSTLLSLDRHSIIGLTQLSTLRIHGNRRLIYVHPEAFEDLPQLQYLLLHNNNIATIYQTVVTSLPSLRQMTLYDNPLRCDCNVHWLRAALLNTTAYDYNDTLLTVAPSVERVRFAGVERFVCDSSGGQKATRLVDIPISSLSQQCKPTVIALFNDSYQKEVGRSVSFECRAIGVPAPSIHWILSNGKIIRSTSNYSRIRVSKSGTLTVDNLKAEHAGTYTCVATNSVGYDTTNTVLRVHSRHIRILDRGSTNTFITVSWNGTESTIATSDYVIMYREQGSSQPYGQVHLRPYMRKYTISNLKPETVYEFCIAYLHSKQTVKLNCVDIKTKSQLYMMRGIRTISKLTILLALCLTSLGVILICVLMMIVRRYQKRKSYHDPTSGQIAGLSPLANVPPSQSRQQRPLDMQKVGQISNIPLDNLYNPPTTPLCTSTTSLISSQSNA